jgi:dUTP pyrophosphatase
MEQAQGARDTTSLAGKRERQDGDGCGNGDDGNGVPLGTRPPLKCRRLDPKARLPQRASCGAAGYDLYSVQDCVVPRHGKAKVQTGLAVAIPDGHYGRVAPRSSVAWNFVDVGAGVIDADYRGEVIVMLYNHGYADYHVRAGDKVAQLVLERISVPEPVWVDDLDETERGAGGFGSTGH